MKTLKKILEDCCLNINDNSNLAISPNYGTDKGSPKSYIDQFYENKFEQFRNKMYYRADDGTFVHFLLKHT